MLQGTQKGMWQLWESLAQLIREGYGLDSPGAVVLRHAINYLSVRCAIEATLPPSRF